VQTDIAWCVPDGTRAGDTFSLTLSEYLRALPPGFALTDPANGQVVATAVISTTDPAVVTFTMTAYAETHTDVCGTAFVRSGFDNSLTPGQTVPFESVTNDGTTFSTDVTPTGGGPVGTIGDAFKFGGLSADQGHNDPNDAVQWFVVSPVGPLDRVVITDNPGAGENIDCASIDLLQGTRTATNIGGTVTRPTIIVPVVCTPDAVSVTVGPIPAGQAVRLAFRVDLDAPTGPGSHTFTNTANVVSTAPGGSVRTETPSSTLQSSTGGGDGGGNNIPSVDIEKWATADGAVSGDFDSNPGKRVEVGTPIPVTMTIRNDGAEDLIDVTVTDTTITGPDLTGLTCDFSSLGGPATGTTWAGPFLIGTSFECTGTVPAMAAATLHTDSAEVTGTGSGSGRGVTDDDPFNTVTPPVPAIDIEKWATEDGASAGDFDDLPGKAVGAGTPVDVTFTITNTGEEALSDVVVVDTTTTGPDLADLSCDFSPLGGPVLGTTWSGPFAVGDSFECTGVVPGMAVGGVHSDTADVTGIGVESGREVDDEDPFNVTTPESPSVVIVKGDADGNAADAAEDAVTLDDGSAALEFTITNDGDEPLVDVVVSDRVVEGGRVSGLSCTFPDGSVGTTWAGPFAVGDSFDCTAELSGVAVGGDHHDVATVSGTGVASGTTVTDDDPYFARRPLSGGGLAITGSDSAVALGGLAGGLMLVGAAVYLVGRRRSSAV
jgi:hypothetical protein